MVPTQGITWLFSCPDIIPNNINLRQERNSEDKELLKYITGATNSKPRVIGRIEFCRKKFEG